MMRPSVGDGRVRVARVIARMNIGGPAQQISRLMEGLDPTRYDQRLYCGDVEDGEGDYISLRAPHLPHHRISGLKRSVGGWQEVAAATALTRAFREFRPHIVHTHTAKAGVVGRLAAEVAGTPIRVHTFHGHLLNSYWSPRVTAAVVSVERLLAGRTDRLFAVGNQVRDDLVEAGIGRRQQYQVLPPGVAVPAAPPSSVARAALGIPPDALVLVFVGRLTSVKRPDRLLEVARRVLDQVPDALLVVAGEGPLYVDTMAQADDLGQRVRFLGWRADIENVYAAADIAVLTSDNEGMPVGLIEASMYGIPSVTTDVGSAREVVLDGRTGRVTSTDPVVMADAVLDLVNDSDLRVTMGAAARAHAAAAFGAARLVADTDATYRELLLDRGLLRVEGKQI